LLAAIGSAGARAYAWMLDRTLAAPLVAIALGLLVTGAAVASFRLLPQELVPAEDRGSLLIYASVPQGASLDYVDRQVAQIEEIVYPLLDSGEAYRVYSIIRGGGTRSFGFVIVGLNHWDERERSQQEIAAEILP